MSAAKQGGARGGTHDMSRAGARGKQGEDAGAAAHVQHGGAPQQRRVALKGVPVRLRAHLPPPARPLPRCVPPSGRTDAAAGHLHSFLCDSPATQALTASYTAEGARPFKISDRHFEHQRRNAAAERAPCRTASPGGCPGSCTTRSSCRPRGPPPTSPPLKMPPVGLRSRALDPAQCVLRGGRLHPQSGAPRRCVAPPPAVLPPLRVGCRWVRQRWCMPPGPHITRFDQSYCRR